MLASLRRGCDVRYARLYSVHENPKPATTRILPVRASRSAMAAGSALSASESHPAYARANTP